MSADYARVMKVALSCARKGYGNTGPNPLVGAAVLRNGEIVATGYHTKVGNPHAEVEALRVAGRKARGADLVVTLEPCSHWGRTPPCVDAIIAAGIRKVVVACLDPNVKERGAGVARLRQAGIDVVVGTEDVAARHLNEPYFKYIVTGIPFVTVKLAMSLDGRVATATGDSKWISSPGSLRYVHEIRRDSNAILVGATTARQDNPALTVRLVRPDTHPLRVVVTSRMDLPTDLKLFTELREHQTLVYTSVGPDHPKVRELLKLGVEVETVPAASGGVDLHAVLQRLGRRCVSRLMVEGGGMIAGALLQAGLVDRLALAYGPLVIGARGRPGLNLCGDDVLERAPRYRIDSVKKRGEDVILTVSTGPDYTRILDSIGSREEHPVGAANAEHNCG